MKCIFSLLVLFLAFSSCSNDAEPATADTLSGIDSVKHTEKVMDGISTENLFRFFGSNFHLVGNLPNFYFDSETNEYVICGKAMFQRYPANKQKEALTEFHDFLRVKGYEPDGDSSKQVYTKVMHNGKEMVYMTMDELLPKMLPEEEALFKEGELGILRNTSSGVAYPYLANNRNCPLMYASSAGIRIEAKNLKKEIKMENAKEAFDIYSKYMDSAKH
jgi:hypothetical protein